MSASLQVAESELRVTHVQAETIVNGYASCVMWLVTRLKPGENKISPPTLTSADSADTSKSIFRRGLHVESSRRI